jgi:hypothetical protein
MKFSFSLIVAVLASVAKQTRKTAKGQKGEGQKAKGEGSHEAPPIAERLHYCSKKLPIHVPKTAERFHYKSFYHRCFRFHHRWDILFRYNNATSPMLVG